MIASFAGASAASRQIRMRCWLTRNRGLRISQTVRSSETLVIGKEVGGRADLRTINRVSAAKLCKDNTWVP
jgi:hypothetical protein